MNNSDTEQTATQILVASTPDHQDENSMTSITITYAPVYQEIANETLNPEAPTLDPEPANETLVYNLRSIVIKLCVF